MRPTNGKGIEHLEVDQQGAYKALYEAIYTDEKSVKFQGGGGDILKPIQYAEKMIESPA